MREKVVICPELANSAPFDGAGALDWWALSGERIARSRSSETLSVGPVDGRGPALHVKRYRYSVRQTIRGSLRNTWLRRSRVAAEFAMLRRIRNRIGDDVAPRPVAYGERRRAGFLREAFLASETVADATPLSDLEALSEERLESLVAFLRRMHGAGFAHGRLYARNLLVVGDDGFRIVDLDRVEVFRGAPPPSRVVRDYACLVVSSPALDESRLAFLEPSGTGKALIEAELDRAAKGLARRDGPPHVPERA